MGMSSEPFGLFAGMAARDMGIAAATESRNALVEKVRQYLRMLARERGNRCVTADDAFTYLQQIGEQERALGNAAGALFRTGEWEFTGCWTPSTRVSNHARMVRVWRLKDGAGIN
jgi:hypothetical protein